MLFAKRLAGIFCLAHPSALGAEFAITTLGVETMTCLEEGPLRLLLETSVELMDAVSPKTLLGRDLC